MKRTHSALFPKWRRYMRDASIHGTGSYNVKVARFDS